MLCSERDIERNRERESDTLFTDWSIYIERQDGGSEKLRERKREREIEGMAETEHVVYILTTYLLIVFFFFFCYQCSF